MVATKLEFGLTFTCQSGLELFGFCTTDLTNNQKTRETNASEVDDLNAHIAALTSEIERIDGSISSAENDFSEIANAFAEASNIQDRRTQFSCSCNQSSRHIWRVLRGISGLRCFPRFISFGVCTFGGTQLKVKLG